MTCTCLYNNTAEGASSIHQADALAKIRYAKFRSHVVWLVDKECFSASIDDAYSHHEAPERHLALVAACEAALGIECGEVGV